MDSEVNCQPGFSSAAEILLFDLERYWLLALFSPRGDGELVVTSDREEEDSEREE